VINRSRSTRKSLCQSEHLFAPCSISWHERHICAGIEQHHDISQFSIAFAIAEGYVSERRGRVEVAGVAGWHRSFGDNLLLKVPSLVRMH
jgi:hypothetical protein